MGFPHRFHFLALLAYLLLAPGSEEAAHAKEKPEFVLELASPRPEAELGGTLSLTVRLKKTSGKPIEVNTLRLDRRSVSFVVEVDGKLHRITRIHGEIRRSPLDGSEVVRDREPPRSLLSRKEPLVLSIALPAIRAGTLRIHAVYEGLPEPLGSLASKPVEIAVSVPEEGARLMALVETTHGDLVLDFLPDQAFNTVLNFVILARDGRYDETPFHRLLRGYLVQGGDPKGAGTGDPGWFLPAELDGRVPHERGVISMSHRKPLDSGGSQFFILLRDDPELDGEYAAFGKVIAGIESLDLMAALPVEANSFGEKSKPKVPPRIRKVRLTVR